jgi:peptidoglycan/xylan/chitin deacetylase (PgdA/CDA1 family)
MNGARSAILTYHSLDASGSVISIHPDLFRRQMERLAACGTPVVRLADARTTFGVVALTFDDAFRNFATEALPVLKQYRFPATVFVVSGHAGARNNWGDRMSGIPALDLMSWDELRTAAWDGVELGAHSVRHPDFTKLPVEEVEREMIECRAVLEERTGSAVGSLAYPYGSSTREVRVLAARHFRAACGTTLDFVTPASDPFDLPRLDVYYLKRLDRFEAAVTGGGSAYLSLRRSMRAVRRIL